MRTPGIEPVTPPNSTKDLQQSIALNRESTAENTQEITALARKLASLSDEQRAVLAALLAGKPAPVGDASFRTVISPKRNRNSCNVE